MLKTYEVMIKDGQLTWLDEQPKITSAHAIITILEEKPQETSEQKKSKAEKAYKILAQLGGSQPDLQPIPRRRFEEKTDDFS